jgi:hypothetical protein
LKIFNKDLIEHVIIPILSNVQAEEDHNLKQFAIMQLIEYAKACRCEKNILDIIEIFEKVIN